MTLTLSKIIKTHHLRYALFGSFLTLASTYGYASESTCKDLDKYNTRSQQVSVPTSTCETLLGDAGGFRSYLADNGWGFQLTFNPSTINDLKGHSAQPQQYSGQNYTWVQNTSVTLTYDLERIGFSKDAQLTISPQYQTSNYRDGNPLLHNMAIFAVNQPLLDRQLELQYGFYPLIRMYYGMVLGGNSSSAALGPTSVIPVQLGLSFQAPTPSATIIVRDSSKRFYNNFSVSRSVSPLGSNEDVKQNPYGLKLNVDGANPVLVNEFGFKQEASATQHSWWFRAGGIYNTTHYDYYMREGSSDNNYGGYIANTVQLTQPEPGSPAGLYLDTKASYAPDDRNAYAKDFQVTLFDIGLFPGREQDMTSLGFTRSWISSKFRQYQREENQQSAASSINALSLSHALRVTKGIYWVNGVTWQDNPTLAPEHTDALLWQSSLYLTF